MKILVAGGAGFLGSNLCDRLFKDGHEVVCIDNFHTGSKENIKHLIRHHRFYLLKADIEKCISLPAYRPLYGVAQIYNFASPAAPGIYRDHPDETVRANVLGVMNLLLLARTCKIPMLQVSTIKVSEGNGSLNADSCYVNSKRCAEALCWQEREKYGVDVKIARLFNTYGPKMDLQDSRAIPTFVRSALRGKEVVIYGNGKQTDAPCYVEDMIDGLIAFMNTPNCPSPVEFGGSEEVSILKLARLIIETAESSSGIRFNGVWEGQKERHPTLLRTHELIGWAPRTSLHSGLEQTVEYFRRGLSHG